ncbi:response regulator transcription factor [Balneolales bacterium ANBcel1]|nr:response regulator transcription factor [Balneolales bacterium ANBcel1]
MNPKVLIIDDDPAVAKFIKFRLTKKGFEVDHVDNGIDGLHAIGELQPDLVILDLMMPGIDGREVAEQVREFNLIDPNRIIILSGKEMSSEIKALFELGVHDCIQKPFNIDNLLVRIERALYLLSQKKE